MEKRNRSITSGFLLLLFLLLGYMVRNSSQGILFDKIIMDYIHSKDIGSLLLFMKFISFLGSGTFLTVAIIIVAGYNLIKNNYYIAKLLLASTLGSFLLNFLLKLLINRTRPLEFFLVEQSGLSFPSGHSMVAASMYLTIAYILSEKYKDKKAIIYTISIIIIFIMGLSRIYLGVHWPTDVIAGFIIGYLLYRVIINTIKSPSI